VRPLPRYTLAVMAGFVTFELWVPLVAIVLRVLAGPTVPAAVQVLASLLGLAVPMVVALALSDYLADRPGLVKPYQPKRRPSDETDREGAEGPGAERHSAGPGAAGPGAAGPGAAGPGAAGPGTAGDGTEEPGAAGEDT
jgi:hypothetical protein